MKRSVPDSSTKKFGIHIKDKKNEGEGRVGRWGREEGMGGGGEHLAANENERSVPQEPYKILCTGYLEVAAGTGGGTGFYIKNRVPRYMLAYIWSLRRRSWNRLRSRGQPKLALSTHSRREVSKTQKVTRSVSNARERTGEGHGTERKNEKKNLGMKQYGEGCHHKKKTSDTIVTRKSFMLHTP